MMFEYIQRIRKNFYLGNERSVRTKKNVAFSFILKPINIIIQLILVPLLIGYLNPVKYGIWVTIFSVINWFYLFDIGLGNGLRNKLAEALAKDEKEIVKIYISTSYAVLSIIVILLYFLFLLTDKFINWQVILNAPSNLENEINTLIIFLFTFFSINFLTRLIGAILNADQKNSLNDFLNTISNILFLFIVYILVHVSKSSLVLVGVAIGFSTVLPTTIATFVFFNKNYKQLKPSFKFVKFAHVNELISLGIKFFVLQIAAVVVFTTDNLIITQLFGPAKVTSYNVAFKYFSIFQTIFIIIIAPFWSAFTEAFTKNDFAWIKSKINQLIKLWSFFVFVIIAMLAVSNYVYKIWIGDLVEIQFSLSLFMAIFVIIATWNSIFTSFINGVGKLKISLITASLNAILNIPLSILLAKYFNLGINGVILGTCISLSIGVIIRPMQYWKIINNKASGIWNK